MAFKELTDLSPDTTIALGGTNRKTGKKNPAQIEGYYLGSRKVDDKKKKSGYSYIHVFQTSEGNIGVWGKTDLDRKVLAVTPGTMTRASFDRMVPTPNGDMYKFKVAVDADNTIEVSGAAAEGPVADDTGYNDDAEGFGNQEAASDADDEGNGADEDAAQAAALAAAERKAKVEALLRGGKTKSKN